jgi:DNA-binding transcriptional LysR family regulator
MIENLKALAVFAKVVEHRSFRAAARELELSPSVASHHVSALERRLGMSLLYRSTRHLTPTPDGEQLYASARAMIENAERGLDVAAGLTSAPRGKLRITAPALLAETRFCQDLAEFAREYPSVQLSVTFSERRHDLLRDGLDLALRFGALEDSSLKMRRLTEMPRSLAAAPSYLRGRAAPRGLRDLASWDIIQLGTRPAELELVPPGKQRSVTLTYVPRIVFDSIVAVREMVIAGLGIAIVPEFMVRKERRRRRLVEVLPRWRAPAIPVFAVWPGGTPRPSLTLRFVDFIGPRLHALFASEALEPES